MYSIAKEIDRAGVFICCLQEVRFRNHGKRRIGLDSGAEYDFYWSGPKKKREMGVGVLVRVDKNIITSEPDTNDPRVISMNMSVYGFKIRLVNAYSPTDTNGTDYQKDDFYRKTRKACIPTKKHHKLILTGDFNAITAVATKQSFYNGMSLVEDEMCNNNGTRLKQLCRSEKLCMIQTYFDVPLEERYTWFSNDGKTKRVLDYILTENFIQQYVTNCFVASDCHVDSDHRLIVANLLTPSTKRARWRKREPREVPRNLKSLESKTVRQKFMQEVANRIPITSPNDPLELKSEKIVTALKDAANKSIPQKTSKVSREIWRSDGVLNNLLQERVTLQRNTDAWKKVTKAIKRRVRRLKNQKLEIEAYELNQYASKRQIENLFKAFKDDNHAFKACPNSEKCDPAKLKEHFYQHFKNSVQPPDPVELQDLPNFTRKLKAVSLHGMNTLPPDSSEIKFALTKLKNGKAASDIPAELLKNAIENEEFLNELTEIYAHVWTRNEVPSQWGHSRLVALWKGPLKGKVIDPTTYRGLQVGATLCKVMVVIIINRIHDWYEKQLLDQQQGFRTGRGTTDGIFLAKALQQVAKKTGKEINVLFVDLTAAFDHVDRRWLFRTVKQRIKNETDCKLFDLLETLYSSTTSALSKHELETFVIELGVRQGGSESPLLFNLYIDYVMRVFLLECAKQNIKFVKTKYSIPTHASSTQSMFGEYGEMVFDWIGYADDLLLAFADRGSLDKGMQILDDVFKRFRLAINVSKTKTMIFNYQGGEDEYPKTITMVGNEAVGNVKEFRYLGSLIHYRQVTTGDAEITSRIDMAEAKFYEHGKKFMNHKLNLPVRASILNSLVRSRLTYGCQSWILTAEQQDRINAAYTSMIRKMVRKGYERKQNEWAYKLTNKNLLDIARTESACSFVGKQRKQYLAHVIRLPNTSLVKRMMFNAEPTTVPGRQKTFVGSVLGNESTSMQIFGPLALSRKI